MCWKCIFPAPAQSHWCRTLRVSSRGLHFPQAFKCHKGSSIKIPEMMNELWNTHTVRSYANRLFYKFSFYLHQTLGGGYNSQHSSIFQLRNFGQGTQPGLGPGSTLAPDWVVCFFSLRINIFKRISGQEPSGMDPQWWCFWQQNWWEAITQCRKCQEELNLFDNSIAPFGFAQMVPVVEVNRAYNLISSSCKQSLSLGGGMMMGFSQPCSFTFYRDNA